MSLFLPIGQRLAEERQRIGVNQTQFAEIAAVTRKTVFGYESGVRAPDAGALAAWAAVGVDVLYVITGQRSSAQPPAPALSPEQRALLDNYAACTPTDRAFIRKAAATAAQFHALTSRKAKAGKK